MKILGLFQNPQGYQQINSLLRDIYPGHLVQTLRVINKSTAFCAYIPWTLGPDPELYQQINSVLRHVYPEHLVQTLSVINKSTAFCAIYTLDQVFRVYMAQNAVDLLITLS